MSRSLIIGLVVTLAIIFGLAAFFYINFVKVKYTSAVKAVPADAALILEVKNIQQAWTSLSATDMWRDLAQNEAMNSLNIIATAADSLINSNSDLQSMLADNHTVLSFHANKGSKLGVLYITEAADMEEQPDELIKWIAGITHTRADKRLFDKETVYDLVDARQQSLLSVAFRNQLLIISEDGTLVEESIRKLKYHIDIGMKGFEQAKTLAEVGADLNIYVNYNQFPSFLALFNKDEYKGVFRYISAFANWSVLNVAFEKERIGISGVTFTDDSLFQFLDLFKTQSPVDIDLSGNLPLNTAYFLQLNFSNYGQFNSDLNEYLQHTGKSEGYAHYADSIEELYNISLADNLTSLLNGSALFGIHEGGGEDFKQQIFAVIKTQNTPAVQGVFNNYMKAIANRSQDDSSLVYYNGIEIRRLALGNVFKLFYGHPFEHLESPFYILHNDAFLMANNLNTLKLIIDELNNGGVLAENESYQKHRKAAPASNNVSVFLSPGKCFQLPAIYANDAFVSAMNRYAYDFKKFEFAEIQFANTANNTFYTHINLKFNPAFKEGTKVLWQTQLDTTFDMQPVLVYNSERKQTCILVQDVLNTVYYVSNSGEILWQTQLSGKINSQIFEVDPNKNGDIHYLFSTNKMACLVNSKGLNVYGYPVLFPGTATAGINLFDFYSDSTFQFFVPLQNNKIMGYNLNGKPVQGWNPKSIEARVTTRLNAFMLGSGPYLCATSSSQKLLVIGIRPDQPKQTVYPSVSGMFPAYTFANDTTGVTIWITDTTGNLTQLWMTGTSEFEYRQVIPADSQDRYHTIIPASQGYLALAASRKGFSVYGVDGKNILSKVFTDSLTTLPFFSVNTINKAPMIGYTETEYERVNWIDLSGVTYPTLPVKGVTPFVTGDVMLNNTNFLVCGDRSNNLILYRLK